MTISLLNRSVEEVSRPVALPVDHYPGLVKSFEEVLAEQNRGPRIRLNLILTDFGPAVPDQWAVAGSNGKVSQVNKSDVDLSKVALRKDFDEANLYRIVDLMEAMGIQARSFAEGLAEMVGHEVLIEVRHFTSPQSNETINVVGQILPR